MFREMRRKKQAIDETACLEILKKEKRGVLCMTADFYTQEWRGERLPLCRGSCQSAGLTEGVYAAEFLYTFRRGVVGAAACPARRLPYAGMARRKASPGGEAGATFVATDEVEAKNYRHKLVENCYPRPHPSRAKARDTVVEV